MPEKKFKIAGSDIKPLAEGHGGCMATDMITVEGHKVGYMYREQSDFPEDSGWRFFSGKESEEYLEDAEHNYDEGIIPLLDAPIGSAFERRGWLRKFVEVPFEAAEE
jgi:hypothetical protein